MSSMELIDEIDEIKSLLGLTASQDELKTQVAEDKQFIDNVFTILSNYKLK
jgi:hypothetical protein